MQRLTSSQARILEFIERWSERHGRAPSTREISRGLGLKSSSSVQYHLSAMEQRGAIIRGKPGRGIRIVRRTVQATKSPPALIGQVQREMAEVLRRLVNAVLPLQSRQYLTRAELHYIRQAVGLGIAVIQKLDASGTAARVGAGRNAHHGGP